MSMYNEGDRIVLKSKTESHWNIHMKRWLGKSATIMKMYAREKIFLIEEDEYKWQFKTTDIERLEDKEEEAERQRAIAERMASSIYKMDDIRRLVEGVFGEDRVYVHGSNGKPIYVNIHFPEIELTNSKGHKHKILDLYVIFTISSINFDDPCSVGAAINMSGCRSTFTLAEHQASYVHSHLIRTQGMTPSKFCLGSSAFGIILSELTCSLTEDAWMSMLLSLENYLKWESLEGGPHVYMSQVGERQSTSTYVPTDDIQKVIEKAPSSMWSLGTDGISIIPNHPDFVSFMNTFYPIKSLHSVSMGEEQDRMRRANERAGRTGFKWKDKQIYAKIIPTPNREEIEIKTVEPEIISIVENELQREFKQFIKYIRYEGDKQKHYTSVFGEHGVCCTIRKSGAGEQAKVGSVKEIAESD